MHTETQDAPQAVAVMAQPRGQHGRWEANDELLPMPLRKLAGFTGINAAHLHRIMTGKKRPYLDQAMAIADTIGMPLDKLAAELAARSTSNQSAAA